MRGNQDEISKLARDKSPALRADFDASPKHGVRRRYAKAHDDTRLQRCDFGFQPAAASIDLALRRRFMQAARAAKIVARRPLEMLDRVGQVKLAAIDPGFL